MKKRNHNRAEGMTTLTISLSGQLRDAIEERAAAENRSLSNFAQTYLAAIVEEKRAVLSEAPAEFKKSGKSKDDGETVRPAPSSSTRYGRK